MNFETMPSEKRPRSKFYEFFREKRTINVEVGPGGDLRIGLANVGTPDRAKLNLRLEYLDGSEKIVEADPMGFTVIPKKEAQTINGIAIIFKTLEEENSKE